MNRRRAPASVFLVVSACLMAWPSVNLAQNENESVGFQTNHPFESGHFSEDIDTLNGNLHLSVPIGPTYQINQHFGYQLIAPYNSKVWDLSRWDSGSVLERRGALGLGFGLNFGRVYRDVEYDPANTTWSLQCTWYYVSPDGNEHELPVLTSPVGGDACANFPLGDTVDNTFITVGGLYGSSWDGNPATAPTLIVHAPDGTDYEMAHFVQVYNGSILLNSKIPFGGDTAGLLTAYNRDFGGWYVTKITSTRAPSTAYVQINYDTRVGYEHLISSITDTVGRTITFTNGCAAAATPSGCVEENVSPNAKNRAATRTEAIAVPAFKATATLDNNVKATYNFTYLSKSILKPLGTGNAGPANVLTRIDYPTFSTHAGTPPRYSMSFGYGTPDPLQYGEIVTRTIPTGAVVTYYWDFYGFMPITIGSYKEVQTVAYTRQLIRKTLTLNGEPNPATWIYTRDMVSPFGTPYTNPRHTTVLDPNGNETVYSYRASLPDPAASTTTLDTEDGWAPEWNDGLSYQVEYYQGKGSTRRLVRTENRDYDADIRSGDHRDKKNVRMIRQVTTFNDDGNRQSTVAYSSWDSNGHFRVVSESGAEVEGTRMTRTNYLGKDPEVFDFREVSDGVRVLSRADYQYSGSLATKSIQRLNLPATLGSPVNLVAQVGDIKTDFIYDTSLNLTDKKITDQGDAGATQFQMRYTWQGGGYLATKEFAKTISPLTYFTWKAIDRSRDPNTGLIYAVRDTAGVQTDYRYDALGRLFDILPTGTEFKAQVEYVDVLHTSLRQGDPAVMGSNYTCTSATGDYIMSCYDYDTLGRVVKTQKRPYNVTLGYPFQTITYDDVFGRVQFQSEWLWPGQTSVGTTSDYTDPNDPTQKDPFGRPRKVTSADDTGPEPRKILYDYFGQSTRATVTKVHGPDGAVFDEVTTNYRDAWGRLVYVEEPLTGGADAEYTYDLRDNLIRVDMTDKTTLSHQDHTFDYDALNRLKTSFSPENGMQVSVYDALGNVVDQRDGSGNRLLSTYDTAGRLTLLQKQDYWKPGFSQPPSVTLGTSTYDMAGATACPATGSDATFGYCNGKVTKSVSSDDTSATAHTLEIYYTGLNGRMSAERNIFAGWPANTVAPIVTTYNNFGLPSRTDYPEGPAGKGGLFAITYTYANGYPTEAWDPAQTSQAQAKITYNAAGGFQEILTFGNGKTTILPDTRNRPSDITIGKWDSQQSNFSRTDLHAGPYKYDGAGNIYQIGPDAGPKNTYGYDAANRLIKAVDIDDTGFLRTQTYTYDDFGNMYQKVHTDTNGSLTDLFTVRDQTTGLNRNRILTHQSGGTLYTFIYDARGNLVQGDTQTYKSDTRNRMLSFLTTSAGKTTEVARYVYDGTANRVRKEDQARDLWTYYARDFQGRLMSEFRRTRQGTYTPEWTKHYVYLGGRLVGLRENLIPTPPGGLKATTSVNGGTGTVNLTWTPNATGEGTDAVNYKVYRSLQSPISWSIRTTTPNAFYSDSVSADTWYLYVITAVDGSGRESYGSDQLLTKAASSYQLPNVPTGLAAAPWDRRVELTWNANTDSVIGYHVYRAVGGGSLVRLTQEPVRPTAYSDQLLTNGTNYTYAITAMNSVNQESAQTLTVSVTPADYTPPSVPQWFQAVADCNGTSNVFLFWNPSEFVDSVSNYTLFRTPPFPGGNPVSLGGGITTYTDATPVPGTTYTYTLKAGDANSNVSDLSLAAVVRTRDAVGAVVVPKTPFERSADGKVTIKLYQSDPGIAKVRVYRKPNAATDCSAFQLVGEVTPPFSSATVVDATAPNNVAYDYVATNVNGSGQESGFSTSALGIPVGRPMNYSECVEELPGLVDGAIDCTPPAGNSPDTFRRVVVKFTQPPARPYQPFSDHSDGSLGYLVGYRIYSYRVTASITDVDDSTLKPATYDWDKSYCRYEPEVVCLSDGYGLGTCRTGSFCSVTGQACPCPAGAGVCVSDSCQLINYSYHQSQVPNLEGTCSVSGIKCLVDNDCDGTEKCQHGPMDPSLLIALDGRLNVGYRLGTGYDCLAAKAVYRIFANGNWLTVESEFSENYNVNQKVNQAGRCVMGGSEDACESLYSEDGNIACPKSSGLPQTPAAPTATSPSPGTIVVNWGTPAPLAGMCKLASPATCQRNSNFCPSGQYCSEADGSLTIPPIGGRCRLSNPTPCNVTGDCPTSPAQTCVINTDSQIAGWRLYAIESNAGSSFPAANPSTAAYHYLPTSPATEITFDSGTRSHTFTDISGQLTQSDTTAFRFRVAAVDGQGRVSALSPPSTGITPMSSAATIKAPAGVKSVVWTLNDANVDYWGAIAKYNPRAFDGIKISWRDGYPSNLGVQNLNLRGYRVYRSPVSGGPYCVLLKSGPNNPPGLPLCVSDLNGQPGDPNAYSDLYTTGKTGPDRVYVDKTVKQNAMYFYVVTVVMTTGESPYSNETAGISLPHAPQPLSPPSQFKALAPNGTSEWPGIYLKWCPNAVVEAVTGYNVYRSQVASGPYTKLNTSPISPTCLKGRTRCVINTGGSVTQTTGSCTDRVTGTCQVVDSTVSQPSNQIPQVQVDNFVYYYVVTAVRGTSESGYSMENSGWPNYIGSPQGNAIRYDPDNSLDTPCGDMDAELEHEGLDVAQAAGVTDRAAPEDEGVYLEAPYRILGQTIVLPTPNAVPKFTYYHLDHLGTPRVLIDSAGNLVSKHHYMPYGEEMPSVIQSSTNKRQFTGHERDGESGLDYMLARYYSSSLGRFMAVDPSRQSVVPSKPQTWNRYSYSLNNPLSYVDPDGAAAVAIMGRGDDPLSAMRDVARRVNGSPGIGSAKLINSGDVKGAVKFLTAEHKKHPDQAIAITGHSKGANQAIEVAGKLGEKGIKVDILITVDPVFGQKAVSDNVVKAVNYYQTNTGYIGGNQVSGSGSTDVTNTEVVGSTHESIDNDLENTNESVISDQINQTGKSKSGKGSFFSSGSQPHRTNSGGYIDEDGTHWSIQGANVR